MIMTPMGGEVKVERWSGEVECCPQQCGGIILKVDYMRAVSNNCNLKDVGKWMDRGMQ